MSPQLVYSLYGLHVYAPKDKVSKRARRAIAAGVYEEDEIQMLPVILEPALPLVELGAGIGVVSCFANQLLKDPAAHVAVEMHDAVLPVLEVNRAMNRSRFSIAAHTIAYGQAVTPAANAQPSPPETSRWDPAQRLSPAGAPTRGPLRAVVDAYGFAEFNLVMDIEGTEMSLLDNEFELIADRAAAVSVELHPHVSGVDGAAKVVRRLMEAGLQLVAVGEGSVVGLRRA